MKSSLLQVVAGSALLMCCFFPASGWSQVGMPPGSPERIVKMEAELKAMQEEAARNPSRPTIAELQHDLEQMEAERNATLARRSEAGRRVWLTEISFGLNVVLALALLGVLIRRRGTQLEPPSA